MTGFSWGWRMVNEATTLYKNWPIDAKSNEKIDYFVTVPANSSATLLLAGQKIKEGKQPVESNQFMKIISTDKASSKLSLSAGNYHFTFKLNQK